MKKYLTYRHDHLRIEEVEVVRDTDASVWIDTGKKQRRETKVSNWRIYHDSWKDAHRYLLACNRNDIVRHQTMLDNAMQESDALQAMTEPLP